MTSLIEMNEQLMEQCFEAILTLIKLGLLRVVLSEGESQFDPPLYI